MQMHLVYLLHLVLWGPWQNADKWLAWNENWQGVKAGNNGTDILDTMGKLQVKDWRQNTTDKLK